MRLSSRRQPFRQGAQLAPFIDVVFLLVIFFMLSSRLSRFEPENIALPEAQEGEPPRPRDPLRTVTVSLGPDGKITAAGRVLPGPEALKPLLQPGNDVLLRADRALSWDLAAGVLRAGRETGLRRVRIAVEPVQEGE